jgi:NAD(P)-dependent dehydrogenase (short-subunit alcohol dehydrogenase family)
MSVSMQGKIVLVTGATAGIGLATARELARKGAQVTLVGRNPARLAAVIAQISSQTGNPHLESISADLSTRAGVQLVANEFKKRHTCLDVLINNAGAFFNSRQLSVDGLEMTFALNHLNYFHLTNLLLDVLQASSPARIVNVASDAHRGQTLDFGNLQLEKGYSGRLAYGRSKLMNVLLTYELARRLEGRGVTANALHPGFVATQMGMNNGRLMQLVMKLVAPLARSPEEGASTSLYLAVSQEVEGVSGRYYVDKYPVQSDPASYDLAAAQKLWDASLELMA